MTTARGVGTRSLLPRTRAREEGVFRDEGPLELELRAVLRPLRVIRGPA